jgi:putative ABC transport system ATP-binding protein
MNNPASEKHFDPVPESGPENQFHTFKGVESGNRGWVIQARDVHREYRIGQAVVRAVSGVSLEVGTGETLCIMGASGAGKSTLLYILGGLDTPTRGQVLLGDRDLYGISGAARAEIRARRIGFVFQSYHLLPELDVLENVMLPGLNRRGAVAWSGALRERGRELLRAVGMSEREAHRPMELSGGEQQRVALARALMNDPEILLADEPTGNLDSRTGNQVLDYLFHLVAERTRTLVLVTHNQEVADRCQRRLVIHDGRLAT